MTISVEPSESIERTELFSWDRIVMRDVIEESNKIAGSAIIGLLLDIATDLLEHMDHLGGTTHLVSNAELVGKKEKIQEIFSYVETPKNWNETALLKRKSLRYVMSLECVPPKQLSILTQKS